jgi:ABC-2 type transport system permease protein
MVFWPLLALASLGLFTIFTNAPISVKTLLFTGVIGWTCVHLSQHSIGRGFLSGVWHKTLKQTFSAPITLRDSVIGHWLYGVIGSTVGFVCLSVLAMVLLNFNIFSLGLYTPLVIGLAVISGLVIGVIAISIVILVGLRVDFIVWSIVDMIVFISGVYYSITVFPKPIQYVSNLFPVVYVFKGMREVLAGSAALQTFIMGYFVAFIWVIIALVLIGKIENYARRSGFYQKYG